MNNLLIFAGRGQDYGRSANAIKGIDVRVALKSKFIFSVGVSKYFLKVQHLRL